MFKNGLRKVTFKSIIILIVFVVMLNNIMAQTTRDYVKNNMFWSETSFIGKIKGKFKYQLDYQYRRQAFNSETDDVNHINLFENRYQQVLRPWIHYQMNSNIRFSLSPIGWWGTWSVPNSVGIVKFTPEYRICPQITLIQKMGRVEFSHRYRYEFRFIGISDTVKKTFDYVNYNSYVFMDENQKGRFRYFLRAMVPINKKTIEKNTVYVNIFNEIFLGIGKNVGNYNLLDQNRFFTGIGYTFNKSIRCELGYLNQRIFKFNNTAHNNVDVNNVAQLFIIFDDFNDIFKKSK